MLFLISKAYGPAVNSTGGRPFRSSTSMRLTEGRYALLFSIWRYCKGVPDNKEPHAIAQAKP